MQKILMLGAAAATLALAPTAVMSSAEAHAYHHGYRHYGVYAFAPWYAPRHGYGHRYYDRFGSNFNPDRQMVGQGE